ncbi:UBP1-associated protein 2A-like [Magnolia sinica]|uniref:UBP1-associated protein 2A-like n=1 Tax=Magnolia sinica TaxID=86752 RepID=UPI002658EFB9|nr:UBP1-associated protein 2A-like [Magnolia sinica]XP_058080036.1 UBP1-associated protein 2A-like [Magnolia sinica]
MAKKRKPEQKPIVIEDESSQEEEEEEQQEQEESSESDSEEVEEEEEEEDEEEEQQQKQGDSSEAEEDSDSEESESQDESSKRDTIRNLLQPFGKDQLIDILKAAALKNRSIASRLILAAESDPVHRKLFIHGLGWDATNDTLLSAFKIYGPIEDCNVVTDKITGKSKGYGFVLFKTRAGARKALEQPQKKVGGRAISCQLASFGPVPGGQAGGSSESTAGRKIFVRNVPPNVDLERLRAFFGRYGEIEGGPVGCGRGFAIFTYKTAEECRKALEEPIKVFEGFQLSCQRAIEKAPAGNKPVGPTLGAGILQPNDLALAYNSTALLGLNAGMLGQNLNPAAAGLVGQNPALGVGLSSAAGSGLSPTVNRSSGPSSLYGVGLGATGLSGQSGINSISPSVIGSYGSQAALQGLGAYQSAQFGQSSAAAAVSATRSQSGIGLIGSFPPSYLGR